jgi:hypothetical protein
MIIGDLQVECPLSGSTMSDLTSIDTLIPLPHWANHDYEHDS